MRKSLRKRRRGDNFVANSTIFLDGRMKKIMNGTINTDEKELLRYTQLDQPIKDLLAGKFEDVFEKVLDNTNSVHKQMANEPLKTALSNIRKMLYKMEIMFIDKKLPGNLEDVEEKLIQAFVTLSQKVSPATDASKPPPPPATAPASTPATALSTPAAPAATDPAPAAGAPAAAPASLSASDDDAAPASRRRLQAAPAAPALAQGSGAVPLPPAPTSASALAQGSVEVMDMTPEVDMTPAVENRLQKELDLGAEAKRIEADRREKAEDAALASPGWVPEEKSERN